MLTRRFATILPPMSFDEALETTKIYSIIGKLSSKIPLITTRPFRAPHHTISDAGLIGGGQNPRPGEVSLAHNGVLFLDELPEFKKHVLEVLRQPLEAGDVSIARASQTLQFPARFVLVVASNPWPFVAMLPLLKEEGEEGEEGVVLLAFFGERNGRYVKLIAISSLLIIILSVIVSMSCCCSSLEREGRRE